ncbi:hypothetical protein Tco_1059794 [Tanacetum coccineum]
MIRLKKKLQLLKKKIRGWVMDYKRQQVGRVNDLKAKLSVIDKELDQGRVSSDDLLLSRMESMKLLHDFQSSINRDNIQKAKIRWAIEGDENSKFFHAIINKKRANLSVKGVMVDGEWMDDPSRVKEEFHNYFATRFQDPGANRGNINFTFPNRLSLDQVSDLESPISRDEIRLAVWGCGEDKSPGPDGFTFEFFRKFWKVVGPDFCIAVEWFFEHGSFAIGCNSSFVALLWPSFRDLRSKNRQDPLAPFLFILIIESLHLSFSRADEVGIFTGIEIDSIVSEAAKSLGCSIMKTPFKYLGIPVGGNMSLIKAWDESIVKLKEAL